MCYIGIGKRRADICNTIRNNDTFQGICDCTMKKLKSVKRVFINFRYSDWNHHVPARPLVLHQNPILIDLKVVGIRYHGLFCHGIKLYFPILRKRYILSDSGIGKLKQSTVFQLERLILRHLHVQCIIRDFQRIARDFDLPRDDVGGILLD